MKEIYRSPEARFIPLPPALDLLVVFSAEADFEDFVEGEDL